MARGKHERRRAGRCRRAVEQEIAALEVEVAEENAALALVQQQAQKTRAARRRLGVENDRTASSLAPAEAAAATAEQAAAAAWRDIRTAIAELERFDRSLTPHKRRPGHAQAVADTVDAAMAGGFHLDPGDVAYRGAPTDYVEHAFRTRIGVQARFRQVVDMSGWVPADVGNEPARVAPYAQARVTDQTRAALWSYAIPPWTAIPDGTDAARLRAQLGATNSGEPDPPPGEFPGQAPRSMTIDKPWRHTPLIPHARDGADLGYWYHRAAWAQGWLTHDQPVPFWLPAEHATGFAQAAPLPDGVDLRLPFPTVCALFERPWDLTATEPSHEVPYATLLFARGHTVAHRAPTIEDHRRRIPLARAELPTPLELVEHLGADVEGLIFRADEHGRPTDDIAWCLAINHPWGLPLGRIVVPARRSLTRWRTPVENILAGLCLSHWHATSRPGTVGEHTSVGAPSDPATGDVPDVRVLDIGATSPDRARIGDARATTARRAHLRRGCWRWQWVGPGRARQRATWVRDTTVRGTGSIGHQVYRLPRDP